MNRVSIVADIQFIGSNTFYCGWVDCWLGNGCIHVNDEIYCDGYQMCNDTEGLHRGYAAAEMIKRGQIIVNYIKVRAK